MSVFFVVLAVFRFYVFNAVTYDSLIFEVTWPTLEIAFNKWDTAIDLYKWHTKTDIWNYKKEDHDRGRIIKV